MATVAVYVAKPRRPLGVSIIAILVILVGLFEIFLGVTLLFGWSYSWLVDNFAFFNNTTAAALVLLVIGLLSVAVSAGLFAQRIWAWAVVLILMLIELVSALYTFLVPWPGVDWSAFLAVPIPAIVFLYLLLVRDAFV